MIQEVFKKPEKATFKFHDIGICVEHNYLCAVCKKESAVLHMDKWILHPCWKCKKDYELYERNWFTRVGELLGLLG